MRFNWGFKGFKEHTVSFTYRVGSAVQRGAVLSNSTTAARSLYPAALVAWWESQAARPAQTRPCFRGAAAGQVVTPSANLRRTGHFDM